MRVLSEEEVSGNPHPVFDSSLHQKKEVPCQIKSEWLGAEACVPLPPQAMGEMEGPRFLFWSRRLSLRLLLNSFSAGLAMGITLAWFACSQFGRRQRRAETNGERGPVYLRVDKHTKREHMLVPGEKIEADVTPGQKVLALRLSK